MSAQRPNAPRPAQGGGGPDGPQPTVRATAWIELVVIVVGIAIGVFFLAAQTIPAIPLWAGGLLYGIAAADVYLAQLIRSRLRSGQVGVGGGRVHPIAVARAMVLAKASAYVGAVAAGAFAGVLIFLYTKGDDLVATHADRPGSWVGLIGSALLIAAALWLERCCRTPDEPDEQSADTSPA